MSTECENFKYETKVNFDHVFTSCYEFDPYILQ